MLPRPSSIDRFNKEGSLQRGVRKQLLHLRLEKAVSFDTPLVLRLT
jgi:hypothetical protein